ncbi:hypothetical protein FOMAKNOH_02245 [Mannheimia haemolytica]|nr:hypothetical protein FEA50_01210 [Mannheimia haemolytica]TRC68903.1 hypothetical protein FEA31_01685 [Mannheimia haemolytica]
MVDFSILILVIVLPVIFVKVVDVLLLSKLDMSKEKNDKCQIIIYLFIIILLGTYKSYFIQK